ncbi:MarR family winged helix-turn-helix transcriptional regulator [Ruania suaedae]|uniref:MarR family winged helix-turn-helix transcriptional regulator n=1 Tax=Ruania suaedae TaxID=2897774 RepID=UPI001E3C43B5|nr:MarR family winged helix-turn-helix transcriptional regulator [Ruania suaedae]UFU03891.1 MarR family winged helix-turn-helix transcriptional regulator [Ruania suaedae]
MHPDPDQPAQGPGVAEDPQRWPTGRLLSAAARRVERAWDAYLTQWSLSHASVPVLAILAGGGHSQREIADHLDVTEQTTSRIIAGLERSGYVRRSAHPEDRRRHIVEITGDGFAALGALNVPETIAGLVPHDLDEDELAELRRLLIRFLGS